MKMDWRNGSKLLYNDMAREKYKNLFTLEFLQEQFLEKKKTALDIAKDNNTNHHTVLRYLKIHGLLEKRSVSKGRPITNRKGEIFGKITVVKFHGVNRSGNAMWKCRCECGKKLIVSNGALPRRLSCGCKHRPPSYKCLPHWFYHSRLKSCAKVRKLDFTVSMQYLGDLLEKQSGKCALTGWNIAISPNYGKEKTTASLDRIDNFLGYVPDNVQWVHKIVNKMKREFSQSEFVSVCKAVSLNYLDKK